ncbi:TonB family protein [Paucibacter sp. O1-1]|nr:TonB family protein [Paucibacter sp. O1-1]MDA3825533.1 TonB family protein [Paucibacter sp. O1-1]
MWRASSADPSMLVRQIYRLLGLLALAFALIGALLPLLPTTVFLIIAAACFGRASPRLQARLLAHPRFGPLLQDWQREGAIGARAKLMAGAGMALGLGLFCWQARPGPWLATGVTLGMLALAGYVLSRPRPQAERGRPTAGAQTWGLLASLALHLLAPLALWLAGWLPEGSAAPLPAAPVITASLLSPAAPPRPLERRSAPEPSQAQPQRPAAPPRAAPVIVAVAAPVGDSSINMPDSPPAAQPAPPSEAAAPPAPALPPAERISLAGLQSNWQGRVLERLAEFRRYPAGARSRREQGVSHVRLRVNRAGQLLQVRLERGSGHTELDRAALATVRAAVPLPAIPPELPDELELLLPVEFFIAG